MRTKSLLILSLLVMLLCAGMNLRAQNIPPMIGDQVGKPKINYPNPLERTRTQRGSEAGTAANPVAAEKELLGFLENWRAQFSKKDLDSLANCYLQTPELRVYWESHEFSGWDAFKREMQRRFNSPEGFQLELTGSRIHILGRFAWVTARYRRQFWSNGQPAGQDGGLTLILEKRRAAWTILHEHASVIPGTAPLILSTK
jgi:ketosteroid isomerase-like protein